MDEPTNAAVAADQPEPGRPRTLKALREAAGFKRQEDAADFTGLDQTTISKLESGRHPNPKRDTMSVLARAYGVSMDEIDAAIRSGVGDAA